MARDEVGRAAIVDEMRPRRFVDGLLEECLDPVRLISVPEKAQRILGMPGRHRQEMPDGHLGKVFGDSVGNVVWEKGNGAVVE